MEEVLQFDGDRYVSAHYASERYGLTRECVHELARTGVVHARFVGNTWYVRGKDLASFSATHTPPPPLPRSHTFDTRLRSRIVSALPTQDRMRNEETRLHGQDAADSRVGGVATSRYPYHNTNPISLQKEREKKHRREQLLGALDIRFSEGKQLYFDESHTHVKHVLSAEYRNGSRGRNISRSTPVPTHAASPARPHTLIVLIVMWLLFAGIGLLLLVWSFTFERTITINVSSDAGDAWGT